MTAEARKIIWEVAKRRNVPAFAIIGPCRKPRVYRARIEVAKRLRARGYSSSQIGAVLNHDHTTILYYLGRFKKKPQPEVIGWHRPRIDGLAQVKRLPPDGRGRYPRHKMFLVPYAGADPDERWKERPHAST